MENRFSMAATTEGMAFTGQPISTMEGAFSMASAFLAAHYDPALAVQDESPADIEVAEQDRLLLLATVAQAATQIPKRLTADATPEELKLDKKRCRRIQHVAEQCYNSWGGKPAKGTSRSVNIEAAQVNWNKWWENHRTMLMNRIAYIASYGIAHPEHSKWAKSAMVRVQNELNWLTYAMRD